MDKVKQGVKAQKGYTCEACGKPIEPGTLYQWKKGFRGPKATRHDTCPSWSQSERTSGPLADAYAAQENAHSALDEMELVKYMTDPTDFSTVDFGDVVGDVRSILEECANEAEPAKDGTQESFDNMPEGLQQGDTGQMLEERIDMLESWMDTLTEWSAPADEPEEHTEEAVEEWYEELINDARGVIDELEA